MPVRGSGWYKRPYRVTYTYAGRRYHLCYHWSGPWEEEIRFAQNVDPDGWCAWVNLGENFHVERTVLR